MDYHDSSTGTARLAVAKYAATVTNKLGTVFCNPGDLLRPSFVVPRSYPILTGGPGGSGVEAVALLGPEVSQAFQGAFDFISWDPRGVGYTL